MLGRCHKSSSESGASPYSKMPRWAFLAAASHSSSAVLAGPAFRDMFDVVRNSVKHCKTNIGCFLLKQIAPAKLAGCNTAA